MPLRLVSVEPPRCDADASGYVGANDAPEMSDGLDVRCPAAHLIDI